MEILKRQIFEINDKEFKKEEEAIEYRDKLIRIKDLKRLVRPYMKDTYFDMDNALEDVFIAILDNKEKTIDVLERPF